MTQNVTIESFNSWLKAWGVYEVLVMDVTPLRYKELARCQDVIQKANRKFMWSAVYNYDVQFCLSLTLNTSAHFNTVNTTLYTTILDSSAVRKEGVSCQRCKSPNHLWFTSNSKEGCNLFQRNSCQQGTECKCAHVCKALREEHSLADCKYVTGH